MSNIEAGIILTGAEVKSLRYGKANIIESFVEIKDNVPILINCYIAKYGGSIFKKYNELRQRTLLLKSNQIKTLIGKTKRKGFTLVPAKIYFNIKGKVKVDIAVCKGKKNYDKRQSIKEKDWNLNKQKLLKYTTKEKL